MRLLLIEDEEDLARPLMKTLRKQGYAVDVAYDGEQGYELAQVNDYDLLVLDIGLPGLDGLEICRRLRATKPHLLILMLTARSTLADRVTGLDTGADDYLSKPFHLEELSARVRALLRRDLRAHPAVLRCGGLTLDPTARKACIDGNHLDLTPKEFNILEYLMRRQGEVVSHDDLLEHVWDDATNTFTNVVRVHMGSLRRKLGDDAGQPRYIETVIGRGYRMFLPCP
ncbi:MAG TPA: response regulator transcription factor [Chloroflexia bacterium]|jgi:DNA-binding response OmpR family regulator